MKFFNSLDKFTKITIIVVLLLIVATPVIVNQYQTYKQEAAYLPPDSGSSILKPPCTFRFANDVVSPPGYGDVNLDGQVTSADSLAVLRIVAKLPVSIPTDKLKYAYEAGDVNGEPYKISYKSNLDSSDALLISRYVANLDKGFPACHYTSGLFIVN